MLFSTHEHESLALNDSALSSFPDNLPRHSQTKLQIVKHL
jgi:hypothetical protein